MRYLIPLAFLPILSACLPSAGPGRSAIVEAADAAAPRYALVDLDARIADTLAANEYESFTSTFGGSGGVPDLRIGVGDTVVVTIFEAASGGLFSGDAGSLGAASKSVSLPPQPVARNGMISVPYVGQVRAEGLTPAQVQASIEAALRDKAIEPQVIVTVSDSASTFVTVAGEVASPGRLPLNLGGDRILDVIAASGGTKAPAYDSFVRLTRGSETVTVSMARIVEDPSQNVFLRPDDQLYVFTDPQIYTAFGATAQNATFPFQTDRLTLAEAVGRAGGLLDNRADARGVFVFRYEEPELYSVVQGGTNPPVMQSAGIPVVYKLDLEDPNGYFAAQRFLMRDNDVIYVSNAPATDLQKFLGIIGSGVGTARSGTSFVNSVN
jgi:polysaccharide export outer membrane protein